MFDYAKPTLNLTTIPETWDDVRAFAHWWCEAGMPFLPSDGAEVYLSDDATSLCIFRRGRFQVELYLIHPKPHLQSHEHPGVEVIKMRVEGTYSPASGSFVAPPTWGKMSETLRDGESHGNGASAYGQVLGFPLVAFQYWKDRDPCTVAAAWKGPTVGPMQEGLIRRFYPDAFIERGYADITKPANYRQLIAEGKA